jgi:hypothetical protein
MRDHLEGEDEGGIILKLILTEVDFNIVEWIKLTQNCI